MSEKKITIKAVTSLYNVILQLENIIESLKKKYITISSHNKALVLQPEGLIRFEMEAHIKPQSSSATQQFYIKLRWKRKPDRWKDIICVPTTHLKTEQEAAVGTQSLLDTTANDETHILCTANECLQEKGNEQDDLSNPPYKQAKQDGKPRIHNRNQSKPSARRAKITPARS